ncbi:uncharacterized protein LOC105834712 [Monomorium pharaonis]|uniref:uncharacterized protein LOC105834712 n=1 Tax=Monomorium pharaonis TaxID=307658 RepID=UPI00063EED91|nr:uncharacterized protein LOC105834712 [Monomorium pharaonis]
MLLYSLIFIVTTFGLFSDGKSTHPFITCKKDSDDFSNCLKKAIQEAWPLLSKGIPELDFPPLEPLIFEYATAKLNLTEISGELVLRNLTAIGLSKILIHDVKAQLLDDNFNLEIYAELPWMYTESSMKIDGSLNAFKMDGEGYFNETATDIKGTWNISGPIVNNTWIVKHFRIAPSIGTYKIYFDVLTKRYGKEFNDLAVNLVNQFWPTLFQILLPATADIYDPWLIDFPNKIFSKIPFSEIFP